MRLRSCLREFQIPQTGMPRKQNGEEVLASSPLALHHIVLRQIVLDPIVLRRIVLRRIVSSQIELAPKRTTIKRQH
jgi:hypothetical protein